jgi:parvulin-like peptidyl-prolyl isomerase
MGATSFLFVDQQPIYLGQALQYLQAAGKLDGFVGEILRQYVLEQALKTRTDLEISPTAIEQMVTDFRLQHQLNTPEAFAEWLTEQDMDDARFRQQIEFNLRLNQLKRQIVQPKLQEHFIERKLFLDQVVLSRISVGDRNLAEELHHQIAEGASFEQLARDYSTSDDRIFNGMMGLVSRGSLPDTLRAAIDLAAVGAVIEPLELEDEWVLIRLEAVLPATLDDPQVQQTLQDELLEEWIGEQLQRMAIEIQVED